VVRPDKKDRQSAGLLWVHLKKTGENPINQAFGRIEMGWRAPAARRGPFLSLISKLLTRASECREKEDSMRFTRPKISKLGIDLLEFEVVMQDPTKFRGLTSDGRRFEGRYRNGWLQFEYLEPEEPMFEIQVGDRYDMNILPEQVCDLVGLTILGNSPVLSPEKFEAARRQIPIRDWSGATTYYSIDLEYTSGLAQRFLEDLKILFPGIFINFEHPKKDAAPVRRFYIRDLTQRVDLRGTLYVGAVESDDIIVKRLQGHFDRSVDRPLAVHLEMPMDTHSRDYDSYDSAFASRISGRSVHVHPTFRGRITGEIKTESEKEQRQLGEIEALVSRYFFNQIRVIEIDSGATIESFSSGLWHSRDLIGWCDLTKSKFLTARKGDEKTGPIAHLPDWEALA